LFYGCDYKDRDFFYRDELAGMPTLQFTAFWKEENVFVQHRMLENSKYLYDLIMGGAVVYVCG
jgi:sulfite reductase (NADPH) flavoprotein alpha-component